jgi:hypothetical protein
MGAVKSGLGEALDVDVERKRNVLPSAWRGKPFFKGFPDRRVSLAAQCEHQGRESHMSFVVVGRRCAAVEDRAPRPSTLPVAGRDSESVGHRGPPDSLGIILRPLDDLSVGGVEAMVNLT